MTKEEKELDEHEKRMSKFTPGDIEAMTDEEVMKCANLIIEGEPVRGITLNGTYFNSSEEAAAVAAAVLGRVRIAHERLGDLPSRPAVYIDIDGTLLDKHLKPSKCLHEFIEYVTSNYVCFWLTTHERDGETNHLFEHLIRSEIPTDTLKLMTLIWPTHWDMLKTEGINFNGEFIWFEDQPTGSELEILEKNGCSNSIYMVDREKGDGLCKWLKDNAV